MFELSTEYSTNDETRNIIEILIFTILIVINVFIVIIIFDLFVLLEECTMDYWKSYNNGMHSVAAVAD